MNDQVVTKEQIIKLIKDEAIKPEDIYSPDDLNDWHHRTEVEKRVAEEKKAEAERDKNEPPGAKYLDPKRNPLIKI